MKYGKHGESTRTTSAGRIQASTEYIAWRNIKYRCTNPNCQMYPNYGGRDISMCERWADSFENFLGDVGRKPSSKHSIDRYPNNDGNYEPGNVRWATRSEQNSNKRVSPRTEAHKQALRIGYEKRRGRGGHKTPHTEEAKAKMRASHALRRLVTLSE